MKLIYKLIAAAILLFACNCGEPCKDLANKICDCKYDVRYDQDACKKRNISYNARKFTDAQSDKCDDLLDTCTCDIIRQEGDQGLCGLSNVYSEPSNK